MSVRSLALSLVAATLLTVSVTGAGIGILSLAQGDEPAPKVAFEDQSAAEIQAAVGQDMAEVMSVRIRGQVDRAGTVTTIDLRQNTLGACVGTLATDGGEAQIIIDAEGQYLKANKKFWKAAVGSTKEAARISTAVGNKWAKMPGPRGGLATFCTFSDYLAEFASGEEVVGDAEVGAQQSLGGLPALQLISAEETATSVWVSIQEPHYIVRLVTDSNTLDFTEFNTPVIVSTPLPRSVIDFTKL